MSDGPDRSLVSRTSVFGGFAGGLLHAGVAVVLWNYFGFDSLLEMLTVKPLNGAYVLLGMFLLGFVPVLCYVGERVVSPALVVAGCLLVSGGLSLLAGSASAPSAVPTPFALYILSWVGVVALAWLSGRMERRRGRRAAA